jgi:hypothetical protein
MGNTMLAGKNTRPAGRQIGNGNAKIQKNGGLISEYVARLKREF